MAKIDLTKKQVDTVLWELSQGIAGDGGAYDGMLKKIIAKIKEQTKDA